MGIDEFYDGFYHVKQKNKKQNKTKQNKTKTKKQTKKKTNKKNNYQNIWNIFLNLGFQHKKFLKSLSNLGHLKLVSTRGNHFNIFFLREHSNITISIQC